MNEATLPPSPNWYLANILACANDGTVAWGARNAIVIVSSPQLHESPKYSILGEAHIDRVTALAFSPNFGETSGNLLISGGDEHIVRIWNLDSMNAVMAHSYADIKQKVVGVDWSRANSNMVCCVSGDGSLVVWNVIHNVVQQISLGKLAATCLSCSPHNPDLVAVGTKTGLVYIVDVHGNGRVIYKLRGHDSEISSLSWCPVDENLLSSTNTKDLLLASGGKDRSIFLWRAGSDGRYHTELTLPNSPLDSRQHRTKLGTATGGWTAVCWATPQLLLASSSWGELISWDMSDKSTLRPACRLLHACHSRGLFCIGHVPAKRAVLDGDWRSEQQTNTTIWTLAQDRRVVCCKVKSTSSEIKYNIPTQGGYTYCIAASPLDTSRIAFGVGDAMIRLWNLCEPHGSTFDIAMLWQKIKGKVMAIAWHPVKENLLAFGTSEGRIGVFDTNSSKPPILYRQYHRQAVYTLGWGPEPNRNSSYALYSCGDGELVYYDSEKPNQEPTNVVKRECTEFSWKPDDSCLAIGFQNGSVSFLNRNLEQCGSAIYSLKKAVQCLKWHPESTSTDLDLSPLRHQLAVSTNTQTIAIFDLTELGKVTGITKDTNTAMGGPWFHKLVGTLNGHMAKIVDLSWSPHISGYLASASYDNTVQVWKTQTQELIATYTSHHGPVYCCMWSPLDPDLLITGSADFTIRIWRLSEQKIKEVPSESLIRSKKVRTKKNKGKVHRATADMTESHCAENTANGTEDNSTEYATTEREIRDVLATDQIRRKKNKRHTYFHLTGKIANDKESLLRSVMYLIKSSDQKSMGEINLPETSCEQCVNVDETQDDEPSRLSIFGTKEEVLKLLDNEKHAHSKLSQYDTIAEMDLWCNNLKQNLQEAAKGKRLNDFLISLTPSLSFRAWQEACETYAAQLEFQGDYYKAVSYLLCIHKIEQAIQVFVKGKLFKEAYLLAKCKLDATDPMVNTLLEAWAVATAKEGNFEDAVLCYIKLGNYREAANCLSRRKDAGSLEVAALIALQTSDEEFSETLAERATNEAVLKADYDSAKRIITTFPQIQHCEVKVAAHKEIKKTLESCNDAKIWNWLEGNGDDLDILQNLLNQYPNCDRHYAKLLRYSETLQAAKEEPELWVEVASQIALATSCNRNEKKFHHLVAAMDTVSRYDMMLRQPARQFDTEVGGRQKCNLVKLLSQLDKASPLSEDSLFANKVPGVGKSLRAYLCYGILNWVTESNVALMEKYGRQELIVSLIENIIGDALDKQTIAYNVNSAEVNKLERLLATAMGKSQMVSDSDTDTAETIENLTERLAQIRIEKEHFLSDRLSSPNPVLVYSKARELACILFDGAAGKRLTHLLSDMWMDATP